MFRILFAAALAAGTATGAARAADAPTATWHPEQGTAGRYCVRATHLETAAMTGSRIYQRTCRSEDEWSARGVTFSRGATAGSAASPARRS